jgi:hypothetical protein
MDCVEVLPDENIDFKLNHRNEAVEIILGTELS